MAQEALIDGQDVVDKRSDSTWKSHPLSRSSKKYQRRLQESLDPTSLEKTLENHRAANMSFLIRRTTTDTPYSEDRVASPQSRQPEQEAEADTVAQRREISEIDDLFENPNAIWFKHLNTGGGSWDKASKIVAAKKRKPVTQVLEYDGRYVAPISVVKDCESTIPWIAQSPMAAAERYLFVPKAC